MTINKCRQTTLSWQHNHWITCLILWSQCWIWHETVSQTSSYKIISSVASALVQHACLSNGNRLHTGKIAKVMYYVGFIVISGSSLDMMVRHIFTSDLKHYGGATIYRQFRSVNKTNVNMRERTCNPGLFLPSVKTLFLLSRGRVRNLKNIGENS